MNPLHQPQPVTRECLYVGSFGVADQNCNYVGSFNRYRVHLTHSYLWLSDELAIPLKCLATCTLKEAGWLIKRRALELIYRNPITRGMEAVYLCDIDFLGFYHDKTLKNLLARIKDAAANLVEAELQKPPEEVEQEKARQAESTLCCEICGNPEAWYVTYQFMAGGIVMWFKSGATRALHCKHHILVRGIQTYLLTVCLGWLGVCIFAYPFVTFAQAMNLKPAVGTKAAYFLAIAPTVAVGLLIAHLLKAF
jgi:hypothetical protein